MEHNLYDYLKDIIRKGNLKKVLELLESSFKGKDSFFENQVINFCSRFSTNERENRSGGQSNNDYKQEKNNITAGLLDLIDDLSEEYPSEKLKIKENQIGIDKKNQSLYIDDYLQSVVSKFSHRQNLFVEIDSKEVFNAFIIENDWSDEDFYNKREGYINEIRQKYLPEKKMVVLGTAGTGKTTTLHYLAFQDALKHQKKEINAIPIYLELNLYGNNEANLVSILGKRLGVEEDDFAMLLKKGNVSLFLDGLNEILPQFKEFRKREIQQIVNDYPNTFVIVSSRNQDYKNDLIAIPVFELQKMNLDKVIEFTEKNCKELTVKNEIIRQVSSNQNVFRIVQVPLILKMLIQVASPKGKIPRTETLIIEAFIFDLYKWQRKNDSNFDVNKVHKLLCWLGYESILIGENPPLTYKQIFTFFNQRNNEFSYGFDIENLIKVLIELNILNYHNNLYLFSHQTFQEYYASEEMEL